MPSILHDNIVLDAGYLVWELINVKFVSSHRLNFMSQGG